MIISKLTASIVETEWRLFDQVQNIGGRASCQDDRTTFEIMRSSQLEAWSEQMRESYAQDLRLAQREGRNPLSEKYAYMMQRTDPAGFAAIRDRIPPRSAQKDVLIDAICAAHVAWLESLALRYPRLVGQGRAIRRQLDSLTVTSFETYLWGELATYSRQTLELYAAYVEKLRRAGKNMNEMILKNTTDQYGFASLEEAERRLAGS